MSLVKSFREEGRDNNGSEIWQYVYTLILLFTHMLFAISFSTLGPAYVDLTYTVDSTIERVSLVSTMIAVGNILGTFFGILYKHFNRQLIITALLTLMSISTTFIPFTKTIWQLYGCALIYGTCAGAWITAYNVWLIEIWQHQSSKVLFMSQLMYGSGAVFGPLMDSSYLTGKQEPIENTTLSLNNTLTNISDVISLSERRSKLEIPFMISGGIQLIIPVLLLVMFVLKKYVKPSIKYEKSIDSTDNSSDSTDNRDKHKVMTIVLLSICLSTINALELVYFNFGSTYFQYIPKKLSAKTGARLVSVMSAAYTVGQVINFFVSFIFRTEYVIATHFLMSFIMFLSLIFTESSENLLWFNSAGIGISVSVLFPAVLGFFGKYIDISDRIATIVWICCGIVSFIPPVVLGHYIETNSHVFILLEIILLFIAFLSLLIFLYLRKKTKIISQ